MHYLFYQVQRSDVAMIKHLLESYENFLQISTIDRWLAKIQVTVAPDFLDDALIIMEDLGKRFAVARLDEDITKSQGNY